MQCSQLYQIKCEMLLEIQIGANSILCALNTASAKLNIAEQNDREREKQIFLYPQERQHAVILLQNDLITWKNVHIIFTQTTRRFVCSALRFASHFHMIIYSK